MHCVVETRAFDRAAKEAGMSDDERTRLKQFLSQNPDAGELMEGTGGARKLRFAKHGKGKRGGYRVVTYYVGEDIPIFLMHAYAKGEKSNLSDAEKNELKSTLATFADDYRKMVQGKVREMKRTEVAS